MSHKHSFANVRVESIFKLIDKLPSIGSSASLVNILIRDIFA